MEQKELAKTTKWEKDYLDDYRKFIIEINAWGPDFIIPVARKSCKLISSVSKDIDKDINKKICYREYFDFHNIDLSNKKIAIIDDVSRRASTLSKYRRGFIKRGCLDKNIRTYAFVGHQDLLIPSLKLDQDLIVFRNRFLSERKYNSYLSVQSSHLLLKNFQSDIDHLVIQTQINGFTKDNLTTLIKSLEELGFYYKLTNIDGLYRFGIQFDTLVNTEFISNTLGLFIQNDFIFKVKFVYEEAYERLTCIPIYFPKVSFKNISYEKFINLKFPFELPLHYTNNDNLDQKDSEKRYYWNICLFCNAMVARFLYKKLIGINNEFNEKFRTFEIRNNDLSRYLGEPIANIITKKIKDFIYLDYSVYDEAFISMSFNDKLFPEKYNNNVEAESILNYLRSGYENATSEYYRNIELRDNLQDIEFVKPVEKLIEVGNNIHPINFSILVDELCDFGIMVPRTKYLEDEDCWRRVYRSGENAPDIFSWRRTKAILSLALLTLGKNNIRIYLEKVLANFTHDFPPFIDRNIKDIKDNHCIYTTPYLFGPINQTVHFELFSAFTNKSVPFQFFNPKHLKNDQNIFNDGEFKKYKEIIDLMLWQNEDYGEVKSNDPNPVFNINQVNFNKAEIDLMVDANVIINYFNFFKTIYNSTGSNKYIFALSIGRNQNLFKTYVSYNVNYILLSIERFIQELKINGNTKNFIFQIGLHIDSIRQKIDAISQLKYAWEYASVIKEGTKENPYLYDRVWEVITNNKNFEEIMSIVEEVQKLSNDIEYFVPYFEFVEEIMRINNGSKSITEKIDNLFNKVDISKSNYFRDGLMLDNSILIENLDLVYANLSQELSHFIDPYKKELQTHFSSTYNLSSYFLRIDIYKRKSSFQKLFEKIANIMTYCLGRLPLKLEKYTNDNGIEKFTFKNPIDECKTAFVDTTGTIIKIE